MQSSKRSSSSKASSQVPRHKPQRRVIPSKQIPCNTSGERNARFNFPTSGVKSKRQERPKKSTKSEIINKQKNGNTYRVTEQTSKQYDMPKAPRKPRVTIDLQPVQQFYRNENYQQSTESIGDLTNAVGKVSLHPIKEVSEIRSQSMFCASPSEGADLGARGQASDSLTTIKQFRQDNYFECHSAQSRVRSRASATALKDHACAYRFYLNDRLFPVPLCTDYNNEIRCIECLLPMEKQVGSGDKLNGTIQAKVSLGRSRQDVMILLPVRDPLIIHERRKEEKVDKDTVFFGLVNLDKSGHSMFKPALPHNSLALKYQKGYRELREPQDCSYHHVERGDVLVI